MPDPLAREADLLRAAYAAFNAKDADAALATMTPDVQWPRAFKGGVVCGRNEVRAYWAEQWGQLDPRVELVVFEPDGPGRRVRQVVRDRAGTLVSDRHVGHRVTFEGGLIKAMEVCEPSGVGVASTVQGLTVAGAFLT